ncbi:MAG: DUF5362 family protein [Sediminibacterium sp.]
MENNLNDLLKLEVSPKLKADLLDAAVWGRIIAIMAFCSSALSLIVSINRGAMVTAFISAGISVFIYLYLFKFGAAVKKALDTNDQQMLSEGLHSLRTYFKILGVIMMIVIIICVLAFVFLLLGSMIKLT